MAAGEPASDADTPARLAQALPVIPSRPAQTPAPAPAALPAPRSGPPPARSSAPVSAGNLAASASRAPSVALILPLAEADFAQPAEAVHAGCRAAFALAGDSAALLVFRTDASAEQTVAAYESAIGRGIPVVVGPLTRSGVTTVATIASAGRGQVTTIALNAPDPGARLPPGFFTFGMSVENEARLAARSAISEGFRKVMVVQTAGALSHRIGQAFASEWTALGGKIADVQDVAPAADLAPLRERVARMEPDMVFLSAEAGFARRIRPYLLPHLAVFSVSLINDGRIGDPGNVDLNGVRFFDMPWLLQPDHSAVMVYPRPALGADLQRFYALGIDACRIAGALVPARRPLMLDGVTGRLTLRRDGGTVDREPVPAVFREGIATALESAP